jgi:hypothetical protein
MITFHSVWYLLYIHSVYDAIRQLFLSDVIILE